MSLHFEEFFGFFLIKGCPIISETPSFALNLLCKFTFSTVMWPLRIVVTAISMEMFWATSSIRTRRKVLSNHLNFLKLFHFYKIFILPTL